MVISELKFAYLTATGSPSLNIKGSAQSLRSCRCLFLWNPSSLMKGSFFIGAACCPSGSIRCLFLESPHHLFDEDFLFYKVLINQNFLTATGSPPFNMLRQFAALGSNVGAHG